METFFGVITEILDKDLYTIRVDIPDRNVDLKAFPLRGEVDEPRVGDLVFLREIDPIYHSYYLYEKVKENKFIGIRSRGKRIKINEERIEIGIFDPSNENWIGEGRDGSPSDADWFDKNDASQEDPQKESDITDWVRIDKDGNMDIYMRADKTVKIDGGCKVEIAKDAEVKIGGNCKVEVSGNLEAKVSGNTKLETTNCDINANGKATVNSPQVKITGGQLSVNGSVAPSSGPFCAIPACIFSGAPHGGNMVAGT